MSRRLGQSLLSSQVKNGVALLALTALEHINRASTQTTKESTSDPMSRSDDSDEVETGTVIATIAGLAVCFCAFYALFPRSCERREGAVQQRPNTRRRGFYSRDGDGLDRDGNRIPTPPPPLYSADGPPAYCRSSSPPPPYFLHSGNDTPNLSVNPRGANSTRPVNSVSVTI